jgi:hypothetical protein
MTASLFYARSPYAEDESIPAIEYLSGRIQRKCGARTAVPRKLTLTRKMLGAARKPRKSLAPIGTSYAAGS